MNVHMDVSLQCIQFAWYVSGSRRRFCVAVTRVAVYGGLNFESIKTVERSNRPIFSPDFEAVCHDSAMRERPLTPHRDQTVRRCRGVDVDRCDG